MLPPKSMRIPVCPNCQEQGDYWEKWDAYFCEDCNIWLEDKCGVVPDETGISEECWFNCWERPDTPSLALAQLAAEASHAAFLEAKNSEHGAVICRDNQIIRVFKDDSFEVIKENVEN